LRNYKLEERGVESGRGRGVIRLYGPKSSWFSHDVAANLSFSLAEAGLF